MPLTKDELRRRMRSLAIFAPTVCGALYYERRSAVLCATVVACFATDEFYRCVHWLNARVLAARNTGDVSAFDADADDDGGGGDVAAAAAAVAAPLSAAYDVSAFRAARLLCCIVVCLSAMRDDAVHTCVLLLSLLVVVTSHLVNAVARDRPLTPRHLGLLGLDVVGVVYVPWLWSYSIRFAAWPHGMHLVGLVIACTAVGENGALFLGSLFAKWCRHGCRRRGNDDSSGVNGGDERRVVLGARRIAGVVSPNKTLAGLVGQVATSLLTALAFERWAAGTPLSSSSLPPLMFAAQLRASCAATSATALLPFARGDWLAVGALCAVGGVLGDLFESFFKRCVGVKDTGSVLPGWGGVLDRIDGLLFNFPIVYWYARWHCS
jgi:CDP-diglyceride synthetase